MKTTEPIKTDGEINALLGALKEWNQNYYLFALIAISWGLRCSDILSLTVGSVIAGIGKRVQIADRIMVTEQKTGHRRHIEIQEIMKGNLYEHIKMRQREDGGLCLSDPLILSQKKSADGKRKAPSRQHASYVISACAKKVGIRGHIGTHGLRKTFAHHACGKGVGVDVMQKTLGHSSVAVTHRYACIPEEQEMEAYRKMNFGVPAVIKRARKRHGFRGKRQEYGI